MAVNRAPGTPGKQGAGGNNFDMERMFQAAADARRRVREPGIPADLLLDDAPPLQVPALSEAAQVGLEDQILGPEADLDRVEPPEPPEVISPCRLEDFVDPGLIAEAEREDPELVLLGGANPPGFNPPVDFPETPDDFPVPQEIPIPRDLLELPQGAVTVGRKKLVISNGLFGDSNLDDRGFGVREPGSSNLLDRFRYTSQKFWFSTSNGALFAHPSNNASVLHGIPFSIETTEPVLLDEIQSVFKEVVTLRASVPFLEREGVVWENYIKGLSQVEVVGADPASGIIIEASGLHEFSEPLVPMQRQFVDYVHERRVPLDFDDVEKLNLNTTLTADVDSEYNFFDDTYQNRVAANVEVSEAALPNFNRLARHRLNALNGLDIRNPLPLLDNFGNGLDNIRGLGEEIMQLQAGNSFAEILENARANNRHLKFAADDVKKLDEFNVDKFLLPMFAELEFSTEQSPRDFINVFSELMVDKLILDFYTADENKQLQPFTEIVTQVTQARPGAPLASTAITAGVQRNTLDVVSWMADLSGDLVKDDSYPLSERLTADERTQLRFFKTLMKIVFRARIKTLTTKHFRFYKDLLSGQVAHSEALFYKVDKFEELEDGNLSNDPIQSLYFFNAVGVDIVNYIDSQVKYGKSYAYQISTVSLVIGTNYQYSLPVEAGPNLDSPEVAAMLRENMFRFNVTSWPKLTLVETPYFTEAIRILDKPPIFPDVSIVPFRGVRDKIKINLNSGVGLHEADPIALEESDFELITKMRQNQLSPEGPLVYRSDDPAQVFQIYRMSIKPTQWLDFDGKLVEEIKSTATAADFTDEVNPNVTYYYTFRVKDINGNLSNPTDIYEVRLVAEQNMVFLEQKIFEFEQPKKQLSKSIKQFLYIKPSVLQTIINIPDEEIAPEEVNLGVADEGVWNKTFRIRLTSKHTGRRIELNVRPIQTKHKSEEV